MIDATKLVTAAQPQARMETSAVAESNEPITLQQAKDHLRVVYDDEDAYINMLIVAAREMAEEKINRTIASRLRTITLDSWCDEIRLPKPPVLSIESIQYIDTEGATIDLDEALYYVNYSASPGRITPAYGVNWPSLRGGAGSITITYRAGYEPGTVPQPIVTWMLLAIGAMYQNREAVTAGVQTYSLPDSYMSWFLQPYMVYE